MSSDEQKVAGAMIAGYTEKGSCASAGLETEDLRQIKQTVRQKALQHLA